MGGMSSSIIYFRKKQIMVNVFYYLKLRNIILYDIILCNFGDIYLSVFCIIFYFAFALSELNSNKNKILNFFLTNVFLKTIGKKVQQ